MIRTAVLGLMLGIGICTTTRATDSTCEEPATVTTTLSEALGTKVVAQACRITADKYCVTLRLLTHSKQLQKVDIEAEGDAFQLSLDTSLDVDLDGVPDLGVATGKGRAGDSMHYWIVSKNGTRLLDAGEAPRLTRSKNNPKLLFAIVPGSGDIQSTRMEYRYVNHTLTQTRAVQFHPAADGTYEVTVLSNVPGDANAWRQISAHRITEEQALACMSGGSCK